MTDAGELMNRDGEVTSYMDGKRELLAELLRRRAAEASAHHPLSWGQRALWFLYQRDRQSAAYNTAFTARVAGRVDAGSLRQALQDLMARHAGLRSTFSAEGGEGLQRIHGHREVHFTRRDVRDATGDELSGIVAEDYRQPFDLEQGPVMRVTLFSRSPEEHVLLLALHHIVCDAWSLWVMADELRALWSAATAAKQATLPAPARSYSDFVRWQTELLDSPGGKDLKEYWLAQLAGDLPVLMLPTDYPRPPLRTFEGDSYFFELAPELVRCLQTVAETQGTTLYAVLVAAFEVLLHRYTHQDEFTFGTLTSGRTSPEFASVVGYFANPVVLRATLRGNPRFTTLLAQVRERVLGALAHQDYPYPVLIDELRPASDPSRTPLMDVLFVYQKRQSSSVGEGIGTDAPSPAHAPNATFQLAPFEIPQMEGQFDLTLEIAEGGRAVWKYATRLFDRARIARMADHLQVLLHGIVANPAARVSDLPLLPPAERDRAVTTWNSTASGYSCDRCVHELFEDQAGQTPENVAITCNGWDISYDELNGYANGLARRLRGLGIGPEHVVGVCLERSPEMVVGLLGILKAGGAYLPLEPSYPQERLKSMARNARLRVVLTHPDLRSQYADALADCTLVDVDLAARPSTAEPNPRSGVLPDNLAYVIYTSGSTGDPKGAMNTHRGICNRLIWMQQAYGLEPADRVFQKTPFSFDVSVWEFFWALLNGASIVLARAGGHRDSAYLVETIRAEGVTVLHFVPSMLRAFLGERDVQACRSIRKIFCSGEVLPVEVQNRCHAALPAELHNLYGPTEAAVDVTAWRCEREASRSTVPIGRPIANTQIFILDRHLQPAPVGVPGELYIGGTNLGRGYLNRPDLTAERFVPNAVGSEAGSRLYRTGDVACLLADGTIEYVGRADHQVKVRGVRIELAEIESALLRHPNVVAAAAVVLQQQAADPMLVGYFVARTNPAPSTTALRRFLSTELPQNMIPDAFEEVGELPLTTSGKVDRQRLPPPRPVRPDLDTTFEPPRTDTETVIADVWRKVLRVDHVGVHDNFFELGGHSLRMTQAIGLLEERIGRRLSMVEVFQHPTIHSLAVHLSEPVPEEPERAADRGAQRARGQVQVEQLRAARQKHRATREAQDADHG